MKILLRTTLLVRLVGPVCVGLLALVWSPHVARAGETFVKIRSNRSGPLRDQRGRPDGILPQECGGTLDWPECRLLSGGGRRRARGCGEGGFRAVTGRRPVPGAEIREIDLLLRNTTWTLEREAGLGVHFIGTLFYDAQKVMVRQNSKVSHIAELNGATMCIEKGTNHDENLANYFRAHGLTYQPLSLDSLAEMKEAFFAGRCQAYTSDWSQLTAVRAGARTDRRASSSCRSLLPRNR